MMRWRILTPWERFVLKHNLGSMIHLIMIHKVSKHFNFMTKYFLKRMFHCFMPIASLELFKLTCSKKHLSNKWKKTLELPQYVLNSVNSTKGELSFIYFCLFSFSVPRAKSIQYAQMPFYLSKLSTNEKILDVVLQIREICDDFTSRGIPTYPSGIPFTFWEQYIHLRFYLMLALLCILLVTFITLSVVLFNPWISGIIVSTHFT